MKTEAEKLAVAERGLFNPAMVSVFKSWLPAEFLKDDFKVNFKEDDKSYAIEAYLPGFDKSEVAVKFEKGYVVIVANHKEKTEKKEKGWQIVEAVKKNVERKLYIGENVKDGAIKAVLENGVLLITADKATVSTEKAHTIKIE